MISTKRKANRDGGYHAIKGFAFQFDAAILEAFANPASTVGVEGDQDINRDDFYIQVKLRSGGFFLSSVSAAIKDMLEQFSVNTDRKYRLYCHFPDQAPGVIRQLTSTELAQVLGGEVMRYDSETKKLFLDRFEIMFAADFQAQFSLVLAELAGRHSLHTDEEAVIYHALLSKNLTSLVLSNPPGSRTTSAQHLDAVVRTSERAIFYGGYEKHLGKENTSSSSSPGCQVPNHLTLFSDHALSLPK